MVCDENNMELHIEVSVLKINVIPDPRPERRKENVMSEKKMAIIKNVGFGCRDFRGNVGLWFDVYLNESLASLQCFFGNDAIKVIKDYDVYDVKELEGKPCWIESEGNISKYVGACNI